MLVVAILGLLVNIGSFFVLHGGDRESLNMRGAILHVLGDLLGSAAAIVAALVILATGWTPIDPILSVLVSLLILSTAWSLMRDAAHVLLEGVPPSLDRDLIARDLETDGPGRARGASHACLVARRAKQHGDAACLPRRRASMPIRRSAPSRSGLPASTASAMPPWNRNSASAPTMTTTSMITSTMRLRITATITSPIDDDRLVAASGVPKP